MHALRTRPLLALVIALLLAALNAAIVYALLERDVRELRVSFLDVGQGDAILVRSPSGTDLLIDAGRDRSAVRMLPRELGPLDRTIDIVVATHPDADHIGGLPDVLSRYEADYYLSPGIAHDTSQAERLEAAIDAEGAAQIIAKRGMRIHLGGGAYADVLYPDRDVSKGETNAGSIVMRVVYGDTAFMLTGDAPDTVERYLLGLPGAELESEVLKAGHHGSRSSTDAAWLAAVAPRSVVVSAGEGNSYGHPHAEVIARVEAAGATLVSTIESGTVRFASDGKTVWRR